jgi:hypothetical protein
MEGGHAPPPELTSPPLRCGENLPRGLRPRKGQIAFRRTFLRKGMATLHESPICFGMETEG